MTNVKAVGIDLDGVVARTDWSILLDVFTKYRKNLFKLILHVLFCSNGQLVPKSMSGDIFNNLSFSSAKIDKEAFRYINELSKNGIRIVYITSRPLTLIDDTYDWLRKYDILYPVIFEHNKKTIVELLNLDVLLDDAPVYVVGKAVLLRRWWNWRFWFKMKSLTWRKFVNYYLTKYARGVYA